jgi:hypothetical protein
VITDYATLQSAIADWLLRADLTAQIPTFIQLAEAKMNRDVRLRTVFSQGYSAVTTAAGVTQITLPADFHSVILLDITGDQATGPAPLEYLTLYEYRVNQRANANVTGMPRFYSIAVAQIILSPVPDGEYALSLVYETKLPALSDSNPTNWMLEKDPDLYLYAALAESAPFLDQDERIATWEGAYDKRAEAFKVDADQKRYGGSPLKMRARTIGG